MARCDQCGCRNGEHIIDCPNNPCDPDTYLDADYGNKDQERRP
jgi:hypothetical protein